ncbi:uncharacterized protein LOC124294924 isoform X2 [Neodiprion lecontei]|uniref:Uncharacterized protein LOC124294924 isoform X2 n=1 Tax=Neodiprion lecontei TaxID=441921 RepID=A0ABM3GE07_NEOLC|nr:uncharacterized protein LOC124294924 isoform X2 [Neodiprion lecontei]
MSLNNKAALQQDRVDSLANIDQRLTPEALQAMSLEQAMAQLALVNRTVDRIEALHERIYEEHEEVLEHEYHTAQVYQRGATLYGSLQTRLEAKVNSLKAEATPRHADATQFFATGPSSTKLPHIKLPTFDGDYTKWRGFRDLFTTLIIDAEQLTGAQRMSYLKTQLKDDALALIANVPLTDEAFPAAWDLLVARYDNPRRLLNTYLEELLTTEPVPNHSAPQLNALVLQTQKIIDAMGTLRVSIADWDPILVFVTLRRLVLGVGWNPHHDVFQFNYHLAEDPPATKRAILSEIARLYDPLGFLAPIIIKAKVIMQELWLEKLGWDDQLAPTQLHKWTVFRADLTNLANLRVNRWINLKENVSAELHGFSDASQLAMAAVVYLKVTDLQGNSSVALLCSKTQVAPLKPLTIPRLELNAAVLLTRLTLYVRKTLNLEQIPIYLWTDSAVTLAWIQSQPSRWKTYVRNRVAKIQDTLPGSRWTFIAGKSNPADCASRGLSVGKLLKHPLWWSGPKWLSLSQENWPTIEPPATTATHQEERPGLTFMTFAKTDSHPLQILLERFSRWVSLVRTLGICLRAISRMKKVPQSSLATPLSAGDLEPAKWLLVKYTQGQYFSSELKLLSDGGFLPKNHPLAKLTPFVDYHGILRVGGRLKNSLLDSQQKNPAILPRYSLLTSLLIDHAHKRNFHGGTQLTLAALRQSYWIIGGRVPVRSHILRCVVCARHRGVRAQQLMGQLPPSRVTPARAFLHTGLDYAGPVTLKTFQGRGAKTYKGWIAVFVCFTTSAIHLELVTDYSTGAFIAAYRRFASRRGVCHTIYSDCGTNFVGADATLRAEFASGSKSLGELSHLLATDGTTWKFNPPGAPHFGGKWEAAVKSIKFHLTRTIGEHLMTYEQLTTVLTQIEAVVNSRPLAPLSEDPADLEPLTPGHFLIGEPLTAVPEPSLPSTTESTLTGYKLLQQLLQQFWRRWSNEVLQRHQGISKWHRASNDIKVGSLVLLTDERFPPTKWPLARVIAIHPGKDGHTRVVTLKTATTELTRPIAKLCVLPIEDLDVSAVNPGENVQSTPKLPGRSEVRLTRSKKAALSRAQITRQSIANQ